MAVEISITVPAIPVAQPRQRHRAVHVAGRTCVRNYTPSRDPVNAYKSLVAHAASQVYHGAPHDGPVIVSLLFVFPRPRAMTWKTKPMPRARHLGKPDADNLFKAFVDALTGIVFVDDSRIYLTTIEKAIAAGDEQPHCEATIILED